MKTIATLASVLAVLWGASCASTVGGGSQTNWQSCKKDSDCTSGLVCIAERCETPEASIVADGGPDVSVPETGPAPGEGGREAAVPVESGPDGPGVSREGGGGGRELIDESRPVPGRFGIAYRTTGGEAVFLEYRNGSVDGTPLGVPGTPRFAYDPQGQPILLVPGASQADHDRMNAAVIPAVDVPELNAEGTGRVTVVPVAVGRTYFLAGAAIYDGAQLETEIRLGGVLDSWRDWSLVYGRDGRKYVTVVADLPAGAYFAPVQDSLFWEAVVVAPTSVGMRIAVAADGTVHSLRYCTGILLAPQVASLCYREASRIAGFVDGGVADAYGGGESFVLGDGYKGSFTLSATVALDDSDAPHIAFYRPSPGGFAVAYQGPIVENSRASYLYDAEPLEPPALRVRGGKVFLVVRNTPSEITFYMKDDAGWHATKVGVSDIAEVGSLEIAP